MLDSNPVYLTPVEPGKTYRATFLPFVNNRWVELKLVAMEEGVLEAMPRLEKRTPYLATLANIATLLGLLGTIIGLIAAYKFGDTMASAHIGPMMVDLGLTFADPERGADALAPAVDTLGPAFDRMKDRLANARRRGGLE